MSLSDCFRIHETYYLSIPKSQSVLISFLTESFDDFWDLPKEIITDNMITIMDEAGTEYFPGKVNAKFAQFAKDFGFKIKPCIAGRPRTKGKVESPMKLFKWGRKNPLFTPIGIAAANRWTSTYFI